MRSIDDLALKVGEDGILQRVLTEGKFRFPTRICVKKLALNIKCSGEKNVHIQNLGYQSKGRRW